MYLVPSGVVVMRGYAPRVARWASGSNRVGMGEEYRQQRQKERAAQQKSRPVRSGV